MKNEKQGTGKAVNVYVFRPLKTAMPGSLILPRDILQVRWYLRGKMTFRYHEIAWHPGQAPDLLSHQKVCQSQR